MRLFNFFKKKSENAPSIGHGSDPDQQSKFDFLSKYAEYLIIHIDNHANGNYSPIAAYENMQNELVGYIYLNQDDSYNISAEQVVKEMRLEFDNRMALKKIKSYVIFYHAQTYRRGVDPEKDGLNCIFIQYQMENKERGLFNMPYDWSGTKFIYQGIIGFTSDQAKKIVSTQLTQKTRADYFQERIIIKPEVVTNEIGIKIKQVNNGHFENIWGAIMGFYSLREQGDKLKMDYYSSCFSIDSVEKNELYFEYNLIFKNLKFKAIRTSGANMLFPILSVENHIPFKIKEINEWHNFNKFAAVISGSGKDTFGLKFLCTDYYKNNEIYKKTINQKMNFWGLGLALNPSESQADDYISEDACGYLPNKQLAEFGCFDFLGKVISAEKCTIPGEKVVNGRILKIQLINHPEILNLFDLDVFFCEENIGIQEIKDGMQISGSFQLLGELEN